LVGLPLMLARLDLFFQDGSNVSYPVAFACCLPRLPVCLSACLFVCLSVSHPSLKPIALKLVVPNNYCLKIYSPFYLIETAAKLL